MGRRPRLACYCMRGGTGLPCICRELTLGVVIMCLIGCGLCHWRRQDDWRARQVHRPQPGRCVIISSCVLPVREHELIYLLYSCMHYSCVHLRSVSVTDRGACLYLLAPV